VDELHVRKNGTAFFLASDWGLAACLARRHTGAARMERYSQTGRHQDTQPGSIRIRSRSGPTVVGRPGRRRSESLKKKKKRKKRKIKAKTHTTTSIHHGGPSNSGDGVRVCCRGQRRGDEIKEATSRAVAGVHLRQVVEQEEDGEEEERKKKITHTEDSPRMLPWPLLLTCSASAAPA
jgi:hypothetical protein